MGKSLLSGRVPWLLVLTQAVLLAILASLQFHWLGEVSRAERERMRSGLETATLRFAQDFDRELTRAFLHFQPEGPGPFDEAVEEAARQLEHWRQTAPYPNLVSGIQCVIRDPDGGLRLADLDPTAGRCEERPWPVELATLRQRLETPERRPRGPLGPDRRPPVALAPEVPALLIPRFVRMPQRLEWLTRDFSQAVSGWIVVRLDLGFLREQFLPLLARRYLTGAEGSFYELAVLSADGTPTLIYGSRPEASAASFLAGGDAEVTFFRLLTREELRRFWREARADRTLLDERPARGRGEREPRFAGQRFVPFLLSSPRGAGGWRLVVRHTRGSLEAAVSQVRQRNLAVSFGVLVLLGLTVSMLVASNRRAQRLAVQQMEFVAGITHELQTPLAAIGSLGQNLSDGIVRDPAQAQRYGSMIRHEAERLGGLVDHALELSGILSGKRSYPLEPTSVGDLVTGAAADCRSLCEERGARLEIDLPPHLPPVMAEAHSLRRALGNLIQNAVKYGGDHPVRVSARTTGEPPGSQILLEVADHGPGIERDDLPHVFEPFYRGRNATAAQISGSGLGLSLVRHTVEAHGGQVRVRSTAGEGTTFGIVLPVPAVATADEEHDEQENPTG